MHSRTRRHSTSSKICPSSAVKVTELYQRESARLGYKPDPAQQQVIALFDGLRDRLIAAKPQKSLGKKLLGGLLSGGKLHELQRGLYVWGGVGRGKTWLMDLFFQSLPFRDKQRSHFHRFMQSVHDELKKHKEQTNPLERVADRLAQKARVLCFDELFVTDIADAMLLGNLFRGLFERGVTLVATSNVQSDDLYKEGLQRARFVPAIRLLKEHTQVVHMGGSADYRLRLLERAHTWFDAREAATPADLEKLFDAIAAEPGATDTTLILNHRRLRAHRHADGAIWFSFKELCDGPRGQADYIEIARCYHTVFVTDVPVLGADAENAAKRFVTLVDEFYDRAVKLVVSAPAPVTELYRGSKLSFEFERTKSRLIEMQSQDYLSRPHQA